jgi:diketogulonate reductase-like aldo/keto reductase
VVIEEETFARENIAIFDFELSEEQMSRIAELD